VLVRRDSTVRLCSCVLPSKVRSIGTLLQPRMSCGRPTDQKLFAGYIRGVRVTACLGATWITRGNHLPVYLDLQVVISFTVQSMGPIGEARVRYGADGALKNAGPWAFSLLRPTQGPGAWYLFRHSLPVSPLRPPPHPYPRRVPVKHRCYQTGPRSGIECWWAPDRGEVGITRKIPPRPRVRAGSRV